MTSITLTIPEEEIKVPQAKVLIDVPSDQKAEENKDEPPSLEKAEEPEEEEEEPEPAVPAQEAADLVKQLLEAQSLEAKTVAAEKIGDFARIEANRSVFGSAGAIEAAGKDLLSSGENWNFRRLCLRAIGNLLYENKENRERTAKSEDGKVIEEILSSLNPPAPIDVRKTASGVTTNLAFESPDLQLLLVKKGAVKSLLRILNEFVTSSHEVKDASIVAMACKALCNIASSYATDDKEGTSSSSSSGETENMAQIVGREGVIGPLVSLLKCGDSSVRAEALTTLVALATHSENYVRLITEGGLERLLSIIKDIEEEEDLRKSAAEFLVHLTEDDNLRPFFKDVLSDILHYVVSTPPPKVGEKNEIWAHVFKALGFLSAHQPFDGKLWEQRKTLVALGTHPDPEVKVGVGMIVGNLARSDNQCAVLLEEGILDLVRHLIGAPDGRIQHLGLGTLRNLLVSVRTRKTIAESGIITQSTKALDSRNAHVLFLNMGVLRTLIQQSPIAAKGFLEAEGMEKLMVFFSDDLAEEHVRIRYEASRVLAALLVILPDPSPVIKEQGLKGPIFLLQSNWDILHQEALIALQTLVQSETHRQSVADAGAAEAILKLLEKEKEKEKGEQQKEEEHKQVLTLLVGITKKLTENPGTIRDSFVKLGMGTKLSELLDQSATIKGDGALKALTQNTINQLNNPSS